MGLDVPDPLRDEQDGPAVRHRDDGGQVRDPAAGRRPGRGGVHARRPRARASRPVRTGSHSLDAFNVTGSPPGAQAKFDSTKVEGPT